MFDIGWMELIVIGVVALIVVGPKDLPGMFRTLGRFTAKARALGREFTRAMNDAADESGVKDMAADLRKAANPKSMGLDALKDAADKFEKWEPSKPAAERGGETAKLSKERAEAARKIQDASAKMAQARLDREAAAAEAAGKPAPAAKKPAAKKAPAAKKPAAKTPAARKPATKTPATKKPAAKPKPTGTPDA